MTRVTCRPTMVDVLAVRPARAAEVPSTDKPTAPVVRPLGNERICPFATEVESEALHR
jgi:hypothetical protein